MKLTPFKPHPDSARRGYTHVLRMGDGAPYRYFAVDRGEVIRTLIAIDAREEAERAALRTRAVAPDEIDEDPPEENPPVGERLYVGMNHLHEVFVFVEGRRVAAGDLTQAQYAAIRKAVDT